MQQQRLPSGSDPALLCREVRGKKRTCSSGETAGVQAVAAPINQPQQPLDHQPRFMERLLNSPAVASVSNRTESVQPDRRGKTVPLRPGVDDSIDPYPLSDNAWRP
jgi:hypothetical protein